MSGFISWTNNLKWSLVWFVTVYVFLSLNYKVFYPCCDIWIRSWIYLCSTFCFCSCSILWCWVQRLLGSTAWCSLRFFYVCVWIQHLNLLEVGTNSHSLTLFLFLCDKLYMNSQWMLPSAKPDQTFHCRKKNKNITVSQEREHDALREK